MKKLTYVFAMALSCSLANLIAQSTIPLGFNYQCIVRMDPMTPLTDTPVTLFFEIVEDDGDISYREKLITTTNEYGLVNHIIGEGIPEEGVFEEIDWSLGVKQLQVKLLDESAGEIEIGANRLVSVPFALHAKTVDIINWNALQNLPLGFADGIDNVNDGDTSAVNEDDHGDQITILGTGSTDDPFKVNQDAVTPKWENIISKPVDLDLNALDDFNGSWTALLDVPLDFADGVDNVTDGDSDPTNEDDHADNSTILGEGTTDNPFKVNPDALEPKWENITGKPVNLDIDNSDDFSGFWDDLLNIPAGFADGIDSVNDGDFDDKNEIQDLSLTGNMLGLSDSENDFDLGELNVGGDLGGSLNNLQIKTGVVGQNEIGANAVGSSEIASGAVGSSEILDGAIQAQDLSQMGATNGAILQWNETQESWIPAIVNFNGGEDEVINCGQIVNPNSNNKIAVGGCPQGEEELQVYGDMKTVGNLIVDFDAEGGNVGGLKVFSNIAGSTGYNQGIGVSAGGGETSVGLWAGAIGASENNIGLNAVGFVHPDSLVANNTGIQVLATGGEAVRGIKLEAKGGSNSNDGVLLFSGSDNNGAKGVVVDVKGNGGGASGIDIGTFNSDVNYGMRILSGAPTEDMELINFGNGRDQNYGLLINVKDNDNNNDDTFDKKDMGIFISTDNKEDDFAGFFDGKVAISSKLGIGTPEPVEELHILHKPLPSDDFLTNGRYGLKIENGGSRNNSWTFYTSDASDNSGGGGFLHIYQNDVLNISMDKGGMTYRSQVGNSWRIGFLKGVIASMPTDCSNGFLGSDDLIFSFNGSFRSIIDNSGEYCTVSDRRQKKEIRSIKTVLNQLMLLNPVSYKYRISDDNEESLGFIAQEVEGLFPELVNKIPSEEFGELLTLNYSGFSVLAIKAIQEQQEIIEEQKETLEAQETRIQKMEHEMDEMKSLLLALKEQLEDEKE